MFVGACSVVVWGLLSAVLFAVRYCCLLYVLSVEMCRSLCALVV